MVVSDIEGKKGKRMADYEDEFDYLIDDHHNLSVLPLKIKSGKDYYIHSALKWLVNFNFTNHPTLISYRFLSQMAGKADKN